MNVAISGALIRLVQMSHEDFCYEVFPLENNLLITSKKDLITQFVLDPYNCFNCYVRRHFSFVNDYITLRYPYQSKVIKCFPFHRKSLKNNFFFSNSHKVSKTNERNKICKI